MNVIQKELLELVPLQQLNKALKRGDASLELAGCTQAIRPAVIKTLARRSTVVITRDDSRARELHALYSSYDDSALVFPGKDIIFYQSDIRGSAITTERLSAMAALQSDERSVVYMSLEGLINCLPGGIEGGGLRVNVGDTIDVDEWKSTLIKYGFDNVRSVEHPGEFTVRGGIIDIYPLTNDKPYRIELFGDEIDSIRVYSPQTQISIDKAESVTIDPASEMILSDDAIESGLRLMQEDAAALYDSLRSEYKTEEAARLKRSIDEVCEEIRQGWAPGKVESYMPYFTDSLYGILDYLPQDTLIILDDARSLRKELQVKEELFVDSMTRRLEKGYLLPRQLEMIKGADEIMSKLKRYSTVVLSTLDDKITDMDIEARYYIDVKAGVNYNGSFEALVSDLAGYKKTKKKVVITCSSRTKAKRLASDLLDRDISAYYTDNVDKLALAGEVLVCNMDIDKGFTLGESGFILITEYDIFGKRTSYVKKRSKKYEGVSITSLQDISVGDYVVHENHGIGIYRGLDKVNVDGVTKDYIKIEYADKANLYILASSFDTVQKYAGGKQASVKINSLGSSKWNKTRKSVEKAVEGLADELVELYALRQQNTGFVYSKDTTWQQEFEETFPYEETRGQLEAIEAVKADMESTKIMDRLICGDVGYGKTEIAIRAAFKAVQDGKQVVMLCPTTILAQQHFNTFEQRMKDYPITIGLLSRFNTASQIKEVLRGLKSGSVDIVIATHRALSADVSYNDLGLLIIDEEQRFGVRHKDKIKKLKQNVDVMCLSATPIPRTLHMSLVGIRDMSLLEEAPMDRLPVQTFVFEYNEEMVRDAILRELHRGGQVYYVYNRVNTIEEVTASLRTLIPEATIEYAHGQMSETRLERIMSDFVDGEIDVLIATTIIEIGMDIPNVNTMIIHDAEKLGLAQLYQLRGRIGRSNRMAYAFFMYKRDKILKEVAMKRLSAIKEFADLGSGYKIALRDLEIRGAGNLLGKEQHGHMEAVGYELYCKMLSRAVEAKKGVEKKMSYVNVEIDIDIDAYIPSDYIPDEVYKLDMYKRISKIRDGEDLESIRAEIVDRFGDMPRSVSNLLYIAKIKYKAYNAYVVKISQKKNKISIIMYKEAKLDAAKIPDLIEKYYPHITFSANPNKPEFVYNIRADKDNPIEDVYEYMIGFLDDLFQIRLDIDSLSKSEVD